MVRSPAGRRLRTGDASPDQWLEVPGWRGPLDTLLVLAVTFAGVWAGLVVIPEAANSHQTTVTDGTPHPENDASPPTAGPSQWFAGPVYTGGPAAPTPQRAVATQPVVVDAPPVPAPRPVPRRTTHVTTRTTPPPPARAASTTASTTTGAAVAAEAQPPAAVTTGTTTSETTPATRTTTGESSSTGRETPSHDPTTSSATSTSEAAPGT